MGVFAVWCWTVQSIFGGFLLTKTTTTTKEQLPAVNSDGTLRVVRVSPNRLGAEKLNNELKLTMKHNKDGGSCIFRFSVDLSLQT